MSDFNNLINIIKPGNRHSIWQIRVYSQFQEF